MMRPLGLLLKLWSSSLTKRSLSNFSLREAQTLPVRKHSKILVVRSPRVTARKQVFDEIKEATCRTNSVSIETTLALRQHLYAVCEARSTSKDFCIGKSSLASCKAKRYIISASGEAYKVSDCELLQLFIEISFAPPAKLKAKHL